jgi:hypothetical protein
MGADERRPGRSKLADWLNARSFASEIDLDPFGEVVEEYRS